MKNIHLIENHDEALKIWRKFKLRNFDLLHIDAHIDFGFYLAKPFEWIINRSKTVKELKDDLTRAIVYQNYESDFDKQINIGNYIYPAMEEGIVKDFYWVVPGKVSDFEKSKKSIKAMLIYILKKNNINFSKDFKIKKGLMAVKLCDKKITVCTLDKIPYFKKRVLLDIDVDFLLIDKISTADNTTNIGLRKPWILPEKLIKIIKNKVIKPQITTIAYSVNGGYTPLKYKYLGDEIAYCLAPNEFKHRFARNFKAACYFNNFLSAGKKKDYQECIKLNKSYTIQDNNYGYLYLNIGKFSEAKKEFYNILKVDSRNPAPFLGLGEVALNEKKYNQARRIFSYVLKLKHDISIAKLGLAKAEFSLKNFKKAKILFLDCQKSMPLNAEIHYFLGQIYEIKKKFKKCIRFYFHALKLGLNGIDILKRITKMRSYLNKNDILLIKSELKNINRWQVEIKKIYLKEKIKQAQYKKMQKEIIWLKNSISAF